MSQQYILWCEIQDIIGPACFWPCSVRRFFWSRRLCHWQRVQVAAFVWVNGLNPEVLFDRFDLRGYIVCGSPQHRHFLCLFRYFEQGRSYRLWSWHVLNRQHEWLDRTPEALRQTLDSVHLLSFA